MDAVLIMLRFFLSIKTYLWVTGISMGIFLLGSFIIPKNLAVFSLINDMPLFMWLSSNGNDLSRTFWIYLLAVFMLLLCLCTLICSAEALIGKTARKNLVKVFSPQVLHVAIIFVLLGHGISSVAGYKEDVSIKINEAVEVKGFALEVNEIEFFKNPGENSTRWRVHLSIDSQEHMIELGEPAFYNGVGFYAKSAQEKKMKAVIGLVHDPGVLWEMIGALVFVTGAFGIFYVRLGERQQMKNA